MSSFCPGLAKGGRSAVIITTAAFFMPGLAPGGSCRPKREATALSDWTIRTRGSPVVATSEATIASRLGTM